MAGLLVGAAAQDTTTTTGTGAITLANAVPSTAPAGSTTFANAFNSGGTIAYPISNVFYTIADATGNYEVGIGTLTSATNLTRDFVLFSGVANTTAPYVPAFLETASGLHQNYAAGTKNVFSNPSLAALTTPYWARMPNLVAGNGGDGGFTQDEMSGTFTGVLTDGVGSTNATIRYKVSSSGIVTLQIPATTVNNTGTALSITGIPSFLSNVVSGANTGACTVTGTAAGGVTVPGIFTVNSGATPLLTGTITFQQYTAAAFPALYTALFTASVVRGVPAQVITYSAF